MVITGNEGIPSIVWGPVCALYMYSAHTGKMKEKPFSEFQCVVVSL